MRAAAKVAALFVVLAFPVLLHAQYVAPYVTVQGVLSGASGLPAKNATLTFVPSQVFFVAGTQTVVTEGQCGTDSFGNVVGIGYPQIGPRVSAQYTGPVSLPPATYYVKFTWRDQYQNETLASPEVAVQLTSAGAINVLPPVGNGPPSASGMNVYIANAPGAETFQGNTNSTTAQYSQTAALNTTSQKVPFRNATPCQIVANDAGWPTGTGYSVSLVDASGNTLFSYSEMWQFYGPGSTYNLSEGIPYYHGQVTYPVPILTTPYNRNMQSIAGPLSMGQPGSSGFNIVNVAELGVGTSLPAWGVDVEGAGLAGLVNSRAGYLINGSGGTAGQCLASDGTAFDQSVPCSTTVYYQTAASNGTAKPQRNILNFSTNFTLADSSSPSETTVDLSTTGVTPGSYSNPTLSVDQFGRITTATGGSAPTFNVKSVKLAPGCVATSSNSFNSCSDTLTWPTSFVDANYSPVCTGVSPGSNVGDPSTNVGITLQIGSYTASAITVITQDLRTSTSVAAQFTEIDCVGVHP